jgi:hypothetical protein
MNKHWWKRLIAFVSTPTFDPRHFEKRVHTHGRAPDGKFRKYEALYRRFNPSQHLIENILSPLAFNSPRQSFNSGRYSKRSDVLHKDCCAGTQLVRWRVATILVRDIPPQITAGDGRIFRFFMRHTPESCCFPHSELWCNTSGASSGTYENPSKMVREALRVQLAQRANY